jgi:hypothetical protein
MTDDLLLGGGVEDYDYLNKSRREVDGVDDKEEWFTLKVRYPCRHSHHLYACSIHTNRLPSMLLGLHRQNNLTSSV